MGVRRNAGHCPAFQPAGEWLLLVVGQEQIRVFAGCDEVARNQLINDRGAQFPVATLQLFAEEFGIVGRPGRELARAAT